MTLSELPTADSHRRRRVLPVACILLLFGSAVAFERWPTGGVQGYARRAQPELVLGQDKITRRNAAFLRAGLLKMSSEFCEPAELAFESPDAVTLCGQPCPAPDPARLAQDLPPSTALLPPVTEGERTDLAVVSLVCRSHHLFDPEHGIVTNPTTRGIQSERPAWFSARLGSQVVVESPIGLRIHGGHSRHRPHKSFDLVFREQYGGSDRSPPGLFFGPETPGANQIVLLNANEPSRFNGALATEIAREIGCKTSRLLPAVVYLNGTLIKSPFFLYEHQSREFVKQRFHIDELEWVRLKSRQERISPDFVKWRQWIRKPLPTRTMAGEAGRFDLDDLSAWAFAMSFTSTTDCNQGAYFRNRRNPSAVWHTLVWDMDFAFNRSIETTETGVIDYADDPFRVLIGNRARLFFLLVEHSEEYRRHFEDLARNTLSDRLSPDRLSSLTDRYIDLARTHPASRPDLVQAMEDAQRFLASRHSSYLTYVHDALIGARERRLHPVPPIAAE